MLNTVFRSSGLIGCWVAVVAMILGMSVAMGANLSTTALVLALGVAPGIVIAHLAHGAASPSVAETLYAPHRQLC